MNKFEELREQLLKDGWKEQNCGTVYINGIEATNLAKDGDVIHLSVDYSIDEEVYKNMFGEEDDC